MLPHVLSLQWCGGGGCAALRRGTTLSVHGWAILQRLAASTLPWTSLGCDGVGRCRISWRGLLCGASAHESCVRGTAPCGDSSGGGQREKHLQRSVELASPESANAVIFRDLNVRDAEFVGLNGPFEWRWWWAFWGASPRPDARSCVQHSPGAPSESAF